VIREKELRQFGIGLLTTLFVGGVSLVFVPARSAVIISLVAALSINIVMEAERRGYAGSRLLMPGLARADKEASRRGTASPPVTISQPDIQRLVVVSTDLMVLSGVGEWPAPFREGFQLAFGRAEQLSSDALLGLARQAVEGTYYELNEARHLSNWGATGLDIQDVVVRVVPYGLELRDILNRLAKLANPRGAIPEVAPTSDRAAALFSAFIQRATGATSVYVESVATEDSAWHVVAIVNDQRYEGSITREGRYVYARLAPLSVLKPHFFAQVFIPDAEDEVSQTANIKQLLHARSGITLEQEWPSRFTFGRGAGPGEERYAVLGLGIRLAAWYKRGFVDAVGSVRSMELRDAIRAWLASEEVDWAYVAIESATGQQVRAIFPTDATKFAEAWDALDEALKDLPKLPPGGFSLISWDTKTMRWIPAAHAPSNQGSG
jgi:hypothetical protein